MEKAKGYIGNRQVMMSSQKSLEVREERECDGYPTKGTSVKEDTSSDKCDSANMVELFKIADYMEKKFLR